MLHVAHISFYVDPLGRDPERLLIDWPTLVDVAEAVHRAGARITVIQAAARTVTIVRNGVHYHFLAADRSSGSMAGSTPFGQLLQELQVDVLHVHGLGFPTDVLALSRIAPSTPILLQDHKDFPPRIWRRMLWRRALAKAAGVAFSARAQAHPFIEVRLLEPTTPVYAIPESSSHFEPGDRDAARAHTGVFGDPCVLWVGHLNENKDPLTVLEAVRLLAPQLPSLHLWCCFGSAPLLADVTRAIRRAGLERQVHLLGRREHDEIEPLMQAADAFVLGSLHEGSGYALLEALACGLPPVVTRIAPFEALTDGGRIGRLWRRGDANELASALASIARDPPSREQVRAHFDAELSFDVVGCKLLAAYRDLTTRSRRPIEAYP